MQKLPLALSVLLGIAVVLDIAAVAWVGWGLEIIDLSLPGAGSLEGKRTLGLATFSVKSPDGSSYVYQYTDSACSDFSFCENKDRPAAQATLAFMILAILFCTAGCSWCVLLALEKIPNKALPGAVAAAVAAFCIFIGVFVHLGAKATKADICANIDPAYGQVTCSTEVAGAWIIAIFSLFLPLVSAIVLAIEHRKGRYAAI